MSNHYFKPTRIIHKLMGVACFIFVITLSVSGILLMHTDSLELSKKTIGGQFLPEKYFHVAGAKRSIQTLAFISEAKPSLLLTGTNHGLFRSIDLGKNWEELKQGLFSQDIRAIAVNPKNSKVIYAGTSNGIFKSEDQGENWDEWFDQSSGLTNVFINDLIVDPQNTNTVYAATQSGLFVSHKSGDLWETVGNGIPKDENIQSIQYSAAHPDQLIISTEKQLFRSSSNGKDWENKWASLPSSISSIITLKTDPEFIFVGTKKWFYKSFNGGLNWIKDENRNIKNIHALAIDSMDSANIFLSSQKGLYFTTNSGDTWKEITPNQNNIKNRNKIDTTPITKILSTPALNGEPPLLLAGSKTGLFISKNNGMTWNFVDLGEVGNTISKENFKMDLSKLVTEIHTGRFFGSYFFWLMDLSSLGMIGLSISGLMIIFYRQKIKKNKPSKEVLPDDEQELDNIINMSDSIDDISSNSQSIHDMVEHISIHLEKCKSIYSISREKDEIETIGKHISTLDGKIHHLMDNIDEFAKLTHDFGANRSAPLDSPKEQTAQNRDTEERSSEQFNNPKTKPKSIP